MKIHPESIKSLLGESTEVAVYGMLDCLYINVYNCLRKINTYQAYTIDDLSDEEERPFEHFVTHSNDDTTKQECKKGITNLLIENHQRIQKSEPIIPLIFCIELEEDGAEIKLDTDSVALSKGKKGSITESELRRCYKSYTQLGPEMREVCEQTFKFVRVQQDKVSDDLYHLKELKPFWTTANWPKLWDQRQKNKNTLPSKKPSTWRESTQKYISNNK